MKGYYKRVTDSHIFYYMFIAGNSIKWIKLVVDKQTREVKEKIVSKYYAILGEEKNYTSITEDEFNKVYFEAKVDFDLQ